MTVGAAGYQLVATAATGVNSQTIFTSVTGAIIGDTFTSTNTTAGTVMTAVGAVSSIAAGITAGLAVARFGMADFTFGGNTYVFQHNGSSTTALDAADELVCIVGSPGTAANWTQNAGVLTIV